MSVALTRPFTSLNLEGPINSSTKKFKFRRCMEAFVRFCVTRTSGVEWRIK
jgi:hypothetical protein